VGQGALGVLLGEQGGQGARPPGAVLVEQLDLGGDLVEDGAAAGADDAASGDDVRDDAAGRGGARCACLVGCGGEAGAGYGGVGGVEDLEAGEEVGQLLGVGDAHADAVFRLLLHGGGDGVLGGAQAAVEVADAGGAAGVHHGVDEGLDVCGEFGGLVGDDADGRDVGADGDLVGVLGAHQLLVAGLAVADDLDGHAQHGEGFGDVVGDPVDDRGLGLDVAAVFLEGPGGDPGEGDAG